MVESSKILTVSYGTFSCTLEGFDDSFSTMKAIAEYFRDLAAGDRYFGAEPPTPDAEMLTRIAEREISRRVDVRTSDSGIVLRASDPAQQPFADVPQVAAAPTPAPAPQTATPAEAAPVEEVAAALQPAAPAPQAAKAPPVAASAPADAAAEDTADDTAAPEPMSGPKSAPEAEPEPVMPPAPRRPAMARFKAPAASGIEDAEVRFEDMPMPRVVLRTEAPAHPDAESVAAKLQRIRAVVGGVSPAVASPYAEDLEEDVVSGTEDHDLPAPEAAQAEDSSALSAAFSDAVQHEEAAASPAAMAPDTEADAEDDAELDDTPVMSAAFTADAVEEIEEIEEIEETAEDSEEAAEDTDDTDDQINAVLRNLERAGLRDLALRDQAAEEEIAEAEVSEEEVAETAPETAPKIDDTTTAEAAQTDAAEVEPPALPLRARILRVARRPRPAEMPSVTEDSVTEDQDEAAAPDADPAAQASPEPVDRDTAASEWDDDDAAPSVDSPVAEDDLSGFDPDAAQSTLSDEDEADLQRELAAVAADIAVNVTADAEAAAQPVRRDTLPGTSEAEMSRIMSQADEELADPEASRRRSAIAHLKAAVAATEAARQLGETAKDPDTTEGAFREDLQQVVRPRRASLSDTPAERSERPRPAPLKLVASQRVDIAPSAAAAQPPVQPRRVSTAVQQDDSDAGSFAEFAEQMGASSLQDLLEAAAAYIAFVEGVEDFSRPQIMKKVQQTTTEDFSREDGLRSFGTLLRQGRIAKVRNGRFQVSERTRFKPEARAAEG